MWPHLYEQREGRHLVGGGAALPHARQPGGILRIAPPHVALKRRSLVLRKLLGRLALLLNLPGEL